jgi:hypothetical protein
MKTLAEHWYLPNTGVFFSKDVASGSSVFNVSKMMRSPMPNSLGMSKGFKFALLPVHRA